ncbi:MAG: rod shape-determining protein [Thermoanaerobaculia bacterium]
MISTLRSLAHPDLAVDLGTATTRVSPRSGTMTFSLPSIVGGEDVLHGGVISDVDRAVELLAPMFYAAKRWGVGKPRVVACAPTDANADERSAVEEVVRRAGAAAVALVDEPLAAAVGANLDVGSFFARMIVDIGHGVTDCAIVRSGSLVTAAAARVACSDLELAIAFYILDTYGVEISADATRRLLKEMSFDPASPKRGVTRVTGRLKAIQGTAEVAIAYEDLVEAVSPVHSRIVGVISGFLRDLPAKVGVEVIENGIDLTGGGALLEGMAESIGRATRLDVRCVPDALGSVVRGARRMIGSVEKQRLWA